MADYSQCIQDALKKGKISSELAEALEASANPDDFIRDMTVTLTQQRREASIQAVRLDEAWRNINAYAEGVTKPKARQKRLYEGLVALLAKDMKGRAPYRNIDYETKVYEGKYHSMFADGLSKLRTKKAGLAYDDNARREFVRALYGAEDVDPEIKQLAKDWGNVAEAMRQDFNAMGGHIPKNQDWLLPQKHDARNIFPPKMSRDEALGRWKDTIRPLLDTSKMVDDMGRPLDGAELDAALDYSFDSIVTGGMNKQPDFTAMPRLGKKLSSKGSEKRFLYFKDAESWMTYQDMYGRGDILTTLTDHINGMAHDIGAMKVMGTNPRATFDALVNQLEKEVGLTDKQKAFSDSLFKTAAGQLNGGHMVGVADFMQSVRNVLVASTLGKAFLSSISDVGFQVITARFNNIPSVKVLSRQLSLMNPANEADRITAVKIGLIADSWVGRMHAANRYADTYGVGATAKMAEGVMRASLLEPWTDAGRKAFGMEYSAMLAENFGKSFSDLDPHVHKMFDMYGIEEADWNAFRKTKPLRHKNALFADLTQNDKFSRMVLTETDYAVPTPDARVQAITTGGYSRAELGGQAWRSVMMLKSFPITLITGHWYRAATLSSGQDRVTYLGALMASTTALGYVALQAKDVAAGREPRPMSPETFGAAVMQGGGLGIFGDFLFNMDANRFGGGPVATAFGPTGELVDKTWALTVGNLQQAAKGEDTNVAGEAVQFVRRYTPSIWQTDVMKGALFDQISLASDPRYEKRLRRIRKSRMRDYDQDYWWRPGEAVPEGL